MCEASPFPKFELSAELNDVRSPPLERVSYTDSPRFDRVATLIGPAIFSCLLTDAGSKSTNFFFFFFFSFLGFGSLKKCEGSPYGYFSSRAFSFIS